MARVHARKNKIVTGLTKGVEFLFKKNKIDWVKGTARLAGKGTRRGHRRRRADAARAREIVVATGSAPRSVPGHRDRREAHHHERRSDSSAGGAEVDRDPRQRRGRRGVRVDLPPVRQRGHAHRAAAAPRAERRRGGVGRAREGVQEARHRRAHRRRRSRPRRSRTDAVTIEMQSMRRQGRVAHGREAARRDRSRAGDRRTRRGRGRPHARARLHQGGRRCSARACRASPRSATSSRWARARIRSSRICRRPKASCWPSGSPAATCSRSTTTTCRRAPTAIRRSAASA